MILKIDNEEVKAMVKKQIEDELGYEVEKIEGTYGSFEVTLGKKKPVFSVTPQWQKTPSINTGWDSPPVVPFTTTISNADVKFTDGVKFEATERG